MTRIAIGAVCIFCVATLLTEALGVAYLAVSGRLTSQTVRDLSDVLAGRDIRGSGVQEEQKDATPDSTDDVMESRIVRVWKIDRRERERKIIRDMVDRRAEQLTNEQKKFAADKAAFFSQLKQTSDELNAESAEQARGILLKLAPADAVSNLMALDLDRDVMLIKGLDERAIAALLQEFMASPEKKTVERGRKIFEAISEGQPKRKILAGTAKTNLVSPPTPPPRQQP
ncbi:MAG: hypothetical protein ACE5KM_11510 [Planctomycetaceae bacterium]